MLSTRLNPNAKSTDPIKISGIKYMPDWYTTRCKHEFKLSLISKHLVYECKKCPLYYILQGMYAKIIFSHRGELHHDNILVMRRDELLFAYGAYTPYYYYPETPFTLKVEYS